MATCTKWRFRISELFQLTTGFEFIPYTDGPTKTRLAGLNCKHRKLQPKMFQTGEKIYQIDLFGVYASARAATTADWPISPLREIQHGRRPSLVQSPTDGSKQDNNLMMKNIICTTSLETNNKKFSNWSTHKTVIGRLKKENPAKSGIGKITGDKNIQSLDDYDQADD